MTRGVSSLLVSLRGDLSHVQLFLPLPGAEEFRQWADRANRQLSDYIIPRLNGIEAPLLAVVGGSTGAGKSTLVNSLVEQVVTAGGVIRPTTKAPVLVHHPDDARWFAPDRILPGLARSTQVSSDPRSLQLVAAETLPQGLAILDAPDIDSVDLDNRVLADELLAAADLWLFVTSATRYADAVPWNYLRQAAQRSAVVGVVVDRVPPVAMSVVPGHLAAMMTDAGLGDAPLFAVPETVVDSRGLLPRGAVQAIRGWLAFLASNQISRAKVIMRTLNGAMIALETGAQGVADQIEAQNQALARLRSDAESIFTEAKRTVRAQSFDGTLLRGEVLARWQEFVGTGAFMRSVETAFGRVRDRVSRVVTGSGERVADVEVAVKSGLEALIVEGAQSAVERVEAAWAADPAGRYMINWSGAAVGSVAPDFTAQVEEVVRNWHDDIKSIVAQEGGGKRTRARLMALGVNAVGVALMLVTFAQTAGVTGAEVGIAGGTAVVAQKVLELIFGDEAIRRLTATVQKRLADRVDGLLDGQLTRLLNATLNRFPAETVNPEQLRALVAELESDRLGQMRLLEEQAMAAEGPDVPMTHEAMSLPGAGMSDTWLLGDEATGSRQEVPNA